MSPVNEKRLKRFSKISLTKWKAAALSIPQLDRLEIVRAIEKDMEWTALLSEYMSHLTDEHSHTTARKAAAKRVIKVRKVLGYVCPKQGLAEVVW